MTEFTTHACGPDDLSSSIRTFQPSQACLYINTSSKQLSHLCIHCLRIRTALSVTFMIRYSSSADHTCKEQASWRLEERSECSVVERLALYLRSPSSPITDDKRAVPAREQLQSPETHQPMQSRLWGCCKGQTHYSVIVHSREWGT